MAAPQTPGGFFLPNAAADRDLWPVCSDITEPPEHMIQNIVVGSSLCACLIRRASDDLTHSAPVRGVKNTIPRLFFRGVCLPRSLHPTS